MSVIEWMISCIANAGKGIMVICICLHERVCCSSVVNPREIYISPIKINSKSLGFFYKIINKSSNSIMIPQLRLYRICTEVSFILPQAETNTPFSVYSPLLGLRLRLHRSSLRYRSQHRSDSLGHSILQST